jgi:hypothetical protein
MSTSRLLAACLVLPLLAAPALAQQQAELADSVERALERCNDGMHAIEDASAAPSTIAFRAGPRDVLMFFGVVNVAYAEVGGNSARHPREARLSFNCVRGAACVWSGPWTREMAAARSEHGIVPMSALPVQQPSIALYCPDLKAAQALHRALLSLQRAIAN